MENKILKVTHNAGFFSCCTIRLLEIIEYFNTNREIPVMVDSSSQFDIYKNGAGDISSIFFKLGSQNIEFSEKIITTNSNDEEQFSNYEDLNIDSILPFVNKYFEISEMVKNRICLFEEKYQLDFKNLCSVFYRGLDKVTETDIGTHIHYIEKCKEIKIQNPNIKFLVQTDELDFIEIFLSEFPDSIVMDELPKMRKQITAIHHHIQRDKRVDFAIDLLATTIIVSKCKFLVTHSGNCGLWAVLFRGNIINLYQFITSAKNSEKKYNFWNK